MPQTAEPLIASLVLLLVCPGSAGADISKEQQTRFIRQDDGLGDV
jgi:hypothetical protein